MSEAALDPYAVLGVAPEISDIELRRVYRGLVKRHHPDHNGGSAESAARFAQIQNAYAQIAHNRHPPQPSSPQPPQNQQPPQPTHQATTRSARAAGPTSAGRGHRGSDRNASSGKWQPCARPRSGARKSRPSLSGGVRRPRSSATTRPTTASRRSSTTLPSEFSERLRRSDSKKQFARRLSDLFGRDD